MGGLRKILIMLAFLLALTPLPSAAREGLSTQLTLQHGGLERRYDLFVPPGNPKALRPLVVILHGHGGSAAHITGKAGKRSPHNAWLDVAERERIILLVPDGAVSPDKRQGWNDCRKDTGTNPSTDDTGFLRALVEQTLRDYRGDPARVYVTGTSNGGFMSLRMALEAQDLIAAAAPVVAAMPAVNKCTIGPGKVPVLFINGTEDPLVKYAGGPIFNNKGDRGSSLSVEESVAWWVKHNGASGTPAHSVFPDTDPDDGSTAEKYAYGGDAPVVFIKVIGGGHTEPSLRRHYGPLFRAIVKRQNKDFEMAEEVWSFFKDQRR